MRWHYRARSANMRSCTRTATLEAYEPIIAPHCGENMQRNVSACIGMQGMQAALHWHASACKGMLRRYIGMVHWAWIVGRSERAFEGSRRAPHLAHHQDLRHQHHPLVRQQPCRLDVRVPAWQQIGRLGGSSEQ